MSELNGGEVQAGLNFLRDNAVDFDRRFAGHGVECATCRRDSRAFEFADFFRQKIFHADNNFGDLRHVMNLPVKHCAARMFKAVRRDNIHLPIVVLLGNNSDNRASADVESKNFQEIFLRLRRIFGAVSKFLSSM